MRKFLGILISFFLWTAGGAYCACFFNCEEPEKIIYSESSIKIDALDPKPIEGSSNYYPGLRGPNQLVIYTPKYGMRTGTNEYGTEAAVSDNMVMSLNGADTIIPYNGFVISGHGRAKKWITDNIKTGSKVRIDYENNILTAYLTPESLIFGAQQKIRDINKLLEYYRRKNIIYNDKKAADYLDDARRYLKKAQSKPEKTQFYINESLKAADEALKNTIPYVPSELKGVWVRPVEKTPDEIEKTIAIMHTAGITDIFLETFYHGSLIYDSEFLKKAGVISQLEDFKGFDPLAVWIEEAHKRGMKVHIWFECFYLGNDNLEDYPDHILSVYPEWSNKRFSNYEQNTPVRSVSEHNGWFLDPANLQVKAFLLGVIKEIIEKYKPDGINLDYLRYPQTSDSSYPGYAMTNWGYTKTARAQFKALYGVDPVTITYGTVNWELWDLFRQDKISDFARDVKALASPYNIMVTAVIFPDLKKSSETKMQNWQYWAQRKYVDGLTPLILTGDKNTAEKLLAEAKNNLDPSVKIYPGIFSAFIGGGYEELLMQIQKIREFKFDGGVIFDYAHLNTDHIDALQARIFNRSYEASLLRGEKQKNKFKKHKKEKKKKDKKRRKKGREEKSD